MGLHSINTFSNHCTVLERPIHFPPPSVENIRLPPFNGKENEWKVMLGGANMFPVHKRHSKSIFEYLWKSIPGWELISGIPFIVRSILFRKRSVPYIPNE